jgi:hypothetical protein
MRPSDEKVTVENVNVPESTTRVSKAREILLARPPSRCAGTALPDHSLVRTRWRRNSPGLRPAVA